MINYPKISIVTPSFNQGQYLEETILSVINQNYPNLEYIIIDGGSTDNSVEIIKKYEKHLKYWVSEKDRGQSHAINKGLEHCTGEIFNWLNSDDYYIDGTLFKIADLFLKNPLAHIFAGKEYLFTGDNQILSISNGTFVSKSITETIFLSLFDQPCSFLNFTIFKPLFPLDERFNYVMDADLYVRYLLEYGVNNILFIDEALNMFRLHENSKGVSENIKFDQEKYIFESKILKSIGAHVLLTKYAESKRLKIIDLDYCNLIIDKKIYTRLFCEREIKRIRINPPSRILDRLLFSPFYFKYNNLKGYTLFKCFLIDFLFKST